MSILQRIRQRIIDREYFLSSHAEEEMWEDRLERQDIENAMLCEYCSGETVQKKVRKHHWFERKLYIVENVNAEICSVYDERYYHARTLDEIDSLLSKQHPVKEALDVKVVTL